MDRRSFTTRALAAALGVTGLSVTTLNPRIARAEQATLTPLATASLTRGGRVQAEIYAGPSANEFYVMTRRGREEVWQLIEIPSGADRAVRAMVEEGRVGVTFEQGRTRVEAEVALRQSGQTVSFSLRNGDQLIEGSGSAPSTGEPSSRLALPGLGLVISLIVALIGAALVGPVLTAVYEMRARCERPDCGFIIRGRGQVPSPIVEVPGR
ncbi:hypothetical protein [Pararhodobacter zhoushanensis]|uniref:hypothetical protein n=1 Tax=Pararhodobacter zhoushanensis TaxID=2479545 RepID=UPI000F8E294D|nr:hypothetical protein [Pararhodobacter zhoushanensis]